MANVTVESLRKQHGDKAVDVFNEICDRGGYGRGHENYGGGLDVLGALDQSNTAIDEKEKDKIAKLAGIDRKEIDKRIEDGRQAVERGIRSPDFIVPADMAKDVKRV